MSVSQGGGEGDEPTIVRPPQRRAGVQLGHMLAPRTRLRDYEITGLIGEGGFGIVYLAWDHSLQRKVAIKEYMPASIASRVSGSSAIVVKSERHLDTFRAGLKSFVNEARLLARFDHPSLVKVYRFWEENGTAYMVMPFYEGPTLKAALAGLGHAPSEAELRAWLRPLLDALSVMHAARCYHRDIAPDNILLTPSGPLLLDFGAARRVIGDMTHALTVVLKPGYAPIEQYGDVATMAQGAWTDLYALACVVYYAVTGSTPMSSVERLMDDRMAPLSALAAGRYSPAFLSAVDAALAVRPQDRPQNERAFRTLLDAGQPEGPTTLSGALAEPAPAAPAPSPPYPTVPGPLTAVLPARYIERTTVAEPSLRQRSAAGPEAAEPASQPADAPTVFAATVVAAAAMPAAAAIAPAAAAIAPATASRAAAASAPSAAPSTASSASTAFIAPEAPPAAQAIGQPPAHPRVAKTEATPSRFALLALGCVLAAGIGAAYVWKLGAGAGSGGPEVAVPATAQPSKAPAADTATVAVPPPAGDALPAASAPIASASAVPVEAEPAPLAAEASRPPTADTASIEAIPSAPAAQARPRREPRSETARSVEAAPVARPAARGHGARCSDILQKASLEPLTAEEAAYLKRECR